MSNNFNKEITTAKGVLYKIPFHLLFFISYPVLNLYATNINQIEVLAITRSVIFGMVISAVIYLVNLAALRSLLKAALMTSIIVLLFHFYGHIYDFLQQVHIAGITLTRHSTLSVLWIIIILMTFFFIFRQKQAPYQMTYLFNLMSAALVLLVLIQIITPRINFNAPKREKDSSVSAKAEEGVQENLPGRDVYYIITDAYTRQDVLADQFDFDNTPFLEELENLGFVVLDDARSNYDNTFESLTSSLNMAYLDTLGLPPDVKDFDKTMALVGDLLPHNQVRIIFESMGYTTIAFHTKAPWANLDDADIYYQVDVDTPILNRLDTLSFHDLYLKTTWIRLLFDTQKMQKITASLNSSEILGWIDPSNYAGVLLEISDEERFENIRYMEYKQNLYTLDNLQKVPEIPGKKFVHAHIMVTHSSFVFNQDGSYKETLDESNEAYVEQIEYLNTRLLEIIETILEQSAMPPVIIIQGDHGYLPGKEKIAILHALYLPEGGAEQIYAGLTPVNTFRIILNQYFNYNFERIPDRSFYRDEVTRDLIEVKP